MDKYNQLIHNY